MIEASKKWAEEEFPKYAKENNLVDGELKVEVIAGDSVTGDTPILLRDKETGRIVIRKIESLINNWEKYYEDKEQSDCNYEVWSNDGWNNINRVIRHKTSKRIYEVTTTTGIVKVTRDHSLLNDKGNIVKPIECKKGDKLLIFNDLPKDKYSNDVISKKEARKMGENREINMSILNCSYEVKYQYYIGTGYKLHYRLVENSDIEKQFLYLLLKEIYPNNTINFYNGYLFISKKKEIKEGVIMKIKDLGVIDDYVYDLETEDGTFQAGVGNIIVHNTDSIMCCFRTGKTGHEAVVESFKLGRICGDEITRRLFKPPNELEFEKVANMFLIFKKKRYISTIRENSPDEDPHLDFKGIELKRRDNADIVKDIYQGMIDIVTNINECTNENCKKLAKYKKRYIEFKGTRCEEHKEEDMELVKEGREAVDESIRFLKYKLKELIEGKVEMDKFVVSKTLKGNYASDNQPHVKLVEKMRLRDKGSEPKMGDRVPYVIIEDKKSPINSKVNIYERTEDPEYAKENGINIDIIYYIDKQIRNPITQFLSVLIDNPDEIFDKAKRDYIAIHEKKAKSGFFNKKKYC